MGQTSSGKVPLIAQNAAEVLVLTSVTLMANLRGQARGEGIAVLYNLGPNPVYWTLSNKATGGPESALTVANGIPMPSNFFLVLDNVGGLTIWGITTANQIAGAGVRVTYAYADIT